MNGTKPTTHYPTPHYTASPTQKTLGYLGLIPFIYIAIGLPLPVALPPIATFTLYSLVIVVFMAGTLWQIDHQSSVFSNIITLTGFFVYLLLPPGPQLFLFALLYLVLWGWERKTCRTQYSIDYWQLRCRLTASVVICHLIMQLKLWLALQL